MSCNPIYFTHNGGKVLSDVELHLVFWGQAWQTDPKRTEIISKVQNILPPNSEYLSKLAQYNVPPGPVTVTLGPISNDFGLNDPPNPFKDPADPDHPGQPSDVVDEITRRIGGGAPFTRDRLYMVFMPSGVECQDKNCDQQLCAGQHFYFEHMLGKDGKVYYAWTLYGKGAIERITTVLSEELVEAITNPVPPTGWGMTDNRGIRREISDVCEEITADVGRQPTTRVKTYYSQDPGDCDCVAPR